LIGRFAPAGRRDQSGAQIFRVGAGSRFRQLFVRSSAANAMSIKPDTNLTPQKLVPKIERLFELSAGKLLDIERRWKPAQGTPVFTVKGRYTSRGWTEWTQGFQYGSALLQFDATGDERFLEIGRRGTVERMAAHVSHIGVHDHGFNNVSTYGNLFRLMREGKIPHNEREKEFYELALKVSGAVQAARWSRTSDGLGYIYSFNGPQSLFIDTMRSLRSLAMAYQLGHVLQGERDERICLLWRLLCHARTTATHNVFYGEDRDAYDVAGRVAHECVFNTNNGDYRCPNSQQGYSGFSTWTRGLAWAILGFAEQLELLRSLTDNEIETAGVFQGSRPDNAKLARWIKRMRTHILNGGAMAPDAIRNWMQRAATVTADFYLAHSCADGIPMWDTGAPNLHRLPASYVNKPADPFNQFEPVDSSAAAIAAQGLIRLGNSLAASRQTRRTARYRQAGLTIARTLFSEPYLSFDAKHQGLILHSVYHRPNGWDYIAPGQKVPNGESSMWGDYHARELALVLLRDARQEPELYFFNI
jgi:unsaturated chondroitin disaccharide hydrolase